MARDYVKKGKPPTRGKKTEVVEPAPKRSNKLLFLGLFTLCLIGGFAYFLISIQGSAPEVEVKVVKDKAKEKPLPPLPEEKWDYVKALENKTIEVEVPEKVKSNKKYQMQCASFRQLEQAESMKAQIAFAGLVANVRKTTGSNGDWYRVVLGPYDTKRQAEADKHKLKRSKIYTCQIWGWT